MIVHFAGLRLSELSGVWEAAMWAEAGRTEWQTNRKIMIMLVQTVTEMKEKEKAVINDCRFPLMQPQRGVHV